MIKCPNCGKEINRNAKFCTYCGYPLKHQTSDNQQLEERKQQAKQFSHHYLGWFVSSLKHPATIDVNAGNNVGILSFIISLVLIVLSLHRCFTLAINQAAQQFSWLGNLVDDDTISNTINGTVNTTLFYVVFGLILYFLVLIFVPFLARKVIYGRHESVRSFINVLAGYSNIAIILELIGVVLILLGITFGVLMISLAFMVYTVASFLAITDVAQPTRYDKFYSLLIVSLIMLFLETIILAMVGSGIAQYIQQLL